jgi:hypothetical protein
MGVSRPFRDAETGGDLGIGQTRRNELADIGLPRCEWREPRSGSVAFTDKFRDLTGRVTENTSFSNCAIAPKGHARDARRGDERDGSHRTFEEGPPVHTTRLPRGFYRPDVARAMANAATTRR